MNNSNTSAFDGTYDATIRSYIQNESIRQRSQIQLIASENFVSKEVLYAQGSILTNKYAEGYPKKRYYSGCANIDMVEELAITRAKKLFSAQYVNVQPHSGSQANQAVFLALLKPGDRILSMNLASGGHLTHGSKVNFSGKWFDSIFYSVNPTTFALDYDQISQLALETKPKLIITGYSAYNKNIDFRMFRNIADKVGAYLLADIAHISGIVAAHHHQNPIQYAHVVTSTTHKTLRGPRGGMMMTNDQDIAKKLDSALFPGIQGGPAMHIIAAKAVAFKEALSTSFKAYIKQTLDNAVVLSQTLQSRGYDTLGDTQNHIVLLDLRKKNISGKLAADVLEKCGIIVNKNMIPFDDVSAFVTSGIRMGTAACTTRGMSFDTFEKIGNLIADILDRLSKNEYQPYDGQNYSLMVKDICKNFLVV